MNLVEEKVKDLKKMANTIISISDRDSKGIKETDGVLGLYEAVKKLNSRCVDDVSNEFASWLLERDENGEYNVDIVFNGINPIKRTAKPKQHKYRDYFKTIKGNITESHEYWIRQWCQKTNKGIELTEDLCSKCSKNKKKSRKEGVDSDQIEKHYCCRSYVKFQSVLGYEVSTAHSKKDGSGRNVDIVFLLGDYVFIGEAKEPNSKECLLRAVLEVETYYHRIADKQYFIDSFSELIKKPVISELKKAILVGKDWYKEQKEKQPIVVDLMNHLGIIAFDIEKMEQLGLFDKLN